MDDIMWLKIFFGIFLFAFGVVLLFLAFKLYYKYLIQEKRCTSKVKGIVERYTSATRGGEQSGVRLPVVHYSVNGKDYKVKGPEYKSYRTLTVQTMRLTVGDGLDGLKELAKESTMEFYEDEKQRLVVKYNTGIPVSIKENPLAELYPIGSELDVFYDSNNPELAYVLRYCDFKSRFWFMIGVGFLIWLVDALILIFV